ncbi:MAG TPA: DUF1272 domain-containing protein [Gammaproteobacteria bacterium]|jgi:hypothetical protein|nr:DUF1272 domain-containing protein [Gammaproteobacteria bacterium]
MLTIKPNCERCDTDLAPSDPRARICAYECTFCVDCVESVLHEVCPNCGGNFVPRPIRSNKEWRKGVSLKQHPASTKRVFTKLTEDEIVAFSEMVRSHS